MYKIKIAKDKYELVKKYLETISNIPSLIRTKREYINLRRDGCGGTGGSGSKSCNNNTEDRYIAIIDAEFAITRYEEELQAAARLIDGNMLPSLRRTALEKKYITSRSFLEISDELGYSLSYVREYVIPAAIEELTMALSSKTLEQMNVFLSLSG